MPSDATAWEPLLRLSVFAGVFAAMAAWEAAAPRRALDHARLRRWSTNWAVAILDTTLVRLLFPLAAVGAAWDAEGNGWGLLNAVGAPLWAAVPLSLVALDLAIWAQHVASHRVPLLWRLHQVHHADPDIDVTTAIRFHPVEIALSMALKIALVYALGVPPVAVVAFEIILNGMALFNHANVALPRGLDRWLRLAVVTPDMHRVHHSVLRREHDANFGFNLSLWDRLAGLYVAEPEGGHDGVRIGLEPSRDGQPSRLGFTLALPFRRLR